MISAIEPFYVGAGFGLYLDRRTQIEGWDIEIAFRRMRLRLQALLPLLLVAGMFGMAMPRAAEAQQLPTPVVVDMGARKETGSGPGQRGSKGDPALPSAVLPPTPRATRGDSTTETTALLSGSTGDSTPVLFDVGTTPSDASLPRTSPAVEEGDHSLPPPSPNG